MIINLQDWRKKRFKTHRLESATILPVDDELTEEQLDQVIGGMSSRKFEEWKLRKINEARR